MVNKTVVLAAVIVVVLIVLVGVFFFMPQHNYYMNKSEAASILGQGGSYNETNLILNNKSVITNRSIVWYNSSSSVLNEDIITTNNTAELYKVYYFTYARNAFNQTYLRKSNYSNVNTSINASVDGMTYSSLSYNLMSGGKTYHAMVIVSEKNNHVVGLDISSTNTIPTASSVATAIAQELSACWIVCL